MNKLNDEIKKLLNEIKPTLDEANFIKDTIREQSRFLR